MVQKQNNWLKIIMGVLLVAGMLILAKLAAMMTETRGTILISDNAVTGQGNGLSGDEITDNKYRTGERMPGQPCIVIDPGHGGADPGKVGINGALEKDINLQMAFFLKDRLEQEGFYVILTRDEDKSLSSSGSNNGKLEDLRNRIRLVAEANPSLVVSIHQNSYTSESVCGAQTFYYETSEEGKLLAECIQNHLISTADDGNHRQAKGNTSYFLLKKTPVPTVIVECGFLSNWREAGLLIQNDYQRRMTDAIADGILEYLEE